MNKIRDIAMEPKGLSVPSCQRCRYFSFEGRRGGHCGQLNVPVQGRWTACSLASPVFAESFSAAAQAQLVTLSEVVLLHRREEAIAD